MKQTLSEEIGIAAKYGSSDISLPIEITDNLASQINLRAYQKTALTRWLMYVDHLKARPTSPHLLFHMATGSGKTVLMAALILDLYKRGYRNFLFFVNSTQIIEKTKDNFLNQTSSKYLFAPTIKVGDSTVDIRSVDTFDAANLEAINIHFTTIQGLHRRIQEPRENAVTIEDFRDHRVALISDEAHHLNTLTKKSPTKSEAAEINSWEGTVSAIFRQHPENVLLEFTATVDLEHEAIRKKYRDKVLFDYSLKQFREDGYSKDISLRREDLLPRQRMLQATILSQYRRKVAEAHGLQCKPVILMKSNFISDSSANECDFHEMVDGLTGSKLEGLKEKYKNDDTLSRAFDFIIKERGMSYDDFARELQGDFSREKVINVNRLEDLENQQVQLNSLEDQDNEIRVIFVVDKLNEGWDVLNLFDIVRLYDTRDSNNNRPGKTTIAEAQLIGRGARYFPFVAPDMPSAASEKRKFDRETKHPLRILEEMHYHCSHNPRYIAEITAALTESGMLDETSKTVNLRLKDSFKATEFYKKGVVWTNERVKNQRDSVSGLSSYGSSREFNYPSFLTGEITQSSVFGEDAPVPERGAEETELRQFELRDFGDAVLRFAMDSIPFFHFVNLKIHFPKLRSCAQFQTSENFLGAVSVNIRGLSRDLDNLTPRQKLEITQYVLHQIEADIKRNSVDYVGTRDFKPRLISEQFTDKSLKFSGNTENSLGWTESKIPDLQTIDLARKDWLAYNGVFGSEQEKYLVQYINDQADRLYQRFDDFYLLRNEKAVRLFDFASGQAFEPDFLLFLRNLHEKRIQTIQLFIEPKGDPYMQFEGWKQNFLNEIASQSRLDVIIQNSEFTLYGLPFFNQNGQANRDFRASFDRLTEN